MTLEDRLLVQALIDALRGLTQAINQMPRSISVTTYPGGGGYSSGAGGVAR